MLTLAKFLISKNCSNSARSGGSLRECLKKLLAKY